MAVGIEIAQESSKRHDKDKWMASLLDLSGKPITKVDNQFSEASQLKGWVVDALRSVALAHQLPSTIPFLYVLQPGETSIPWSAEAKAQRQLKQWKKELGGEVVHILVSDPEQKDRSFLAQPVLQDWLGYSPVSLLTLHDAAKTESERLRFRATIIARTGQPPEALLKK